MDTLDIAYFSSIILILLGGAFCIAFFGSKEKNKRDKLGNSFRFRKVRGEIVRAAGKPSLFEPKGSYYYLEKAPFTLDISAEGAKGPDGKMYKALAVCTAFITAENSQTAAESFFGLTTEEMNDMLAEPLEAALIKAIEENGAAEKEKTEKGFMENANNAVKMFGVNITKINDIRILEEVNEA